MIWAARSTPRSFSMGINAARIRPQVSAWAVVDKFASFAQPGHPLSAKTVSLTGITDELLRGINAARIRPQVSASS